MTEGGSPITSARPRWIEATLRVSEGQDPLGLLSMTQDRLMPWLLPGILELSQTARYFAFHAFLLDEYRRRALPANSAGLSRFVKACEWDLGLAVQRCPRGCGSSPVGARRLRAVAGDTTVLRRGESVESALGGYGLYYRSPMISLGLVARSGVLLGDRPTPVDLLQSASPRAARLAGEFRSAVEHTAYVRRWMGSDEPIPADVIDEYAVHACLCRLADRPDEQRAVHDALFSTDPAGTYDGAEEALLRRRQGVAHFLSLVEASPEVATSRSAFRRAAWQPADLRGPAHELVADRWSALMAKDVWQEALCSVWSDFCRRGLEQTRELGRGLTASEVRRLTHDMLDGPPALSADVSTRDLDAAIAAGLVTISGPDDEPVTPAGADLEDLRIATRTLDTATSGLVVLLELRRRAAVRNRDGWTTALGTDSAWQPSVHSVLRGLDQRLLARESAGETLWWLLDRFVVGTHERIAYSKLPDNTFRFRWEEGLLRFSDNGGHRFPLAAIRHEPLRLLTHDLGLWEDPSDPTVTPKGAAFRDEALS